MYALINFSGKQLVSIRMNHDFYQLNDGGDRIDKLIDIFDGESPRLTSMNIENDMKKMSKAQKKKYEQDLWKKAGVK